MAVTVLISQNAEKDTVSIGAEMVADYAFLLTTKPINDIYDVLFFGDGRKPIDIQLVEKILAHFAQKPAGPSAASDTNMNVVSGERIKDHPRDNLAVLLDPHLGERGMKERVQPLCYEAGDAAIMFSGKDGAGHEIYWHTCYGVQKRDRYNEKYLQFVCLIANYEHRSSRWIPFGYRSFS